MTEPVNQQFEKPENFQLPPIEPPIEPNDNTQVEKPKDYLVWSIVNIFFFSFFGGLWCLYLSSQTRKHLKSGNIDEAKRYSRITFKTNIDVTIIGSIFKIVAIVLLATYYY